MDLSQLTYAATGTASNTLRHVLNSRLNTDEDADRKRKREGKEEEEDTDWDDFALPRDHRITENLERSKHR